MKMGRTRGCEGVKEGFVAEIRGGVAIDEVELILT
jgi:hypothetical protein